MPTLKPVGHQSTNWMLRLVLMVAMAALTSLGTTSPRYNSVIIATQNWIYNFSGRKISTIPVQEMVIACQFLFQEL